MMKNFLLPVATAIVSVAMLTACSDDSMLYEPGTTDTPVVTVPVQNSVVLTDAKGNSVSNLSGEYGNYYLNILTDGEWNVTCENAFIHLPFRSGVGSARIPVQIGNNWTGNRDYQIDVHFATGDSRAGGATGSASGTQNGTSTPSELKDIVSSNIFVGYAFTPGRSTDPEFCTGISVFDVPALISANKLLDSYYETSKQYYYESESDSTLDKTIVGNGKAGGTFKKFGIEAGADGGSSHKEGKSGRSGQMSLLQTHFTRELSLGNLVDNTGKLTNTTTGYEYFKTRFINAVKAAGTNEEAKKRSVKDFIEVVGSHIVLKASLGTELDYRIRVDSTYLNDSVGVKAVLGCKFQSIVKPAKKDSIANDSTVVPPVPTDTTAVDSTARAANIRAGAPTTSGDKGGTTIQVGAEVSYSNAVKQAASSTEAQVKVRGGQVGKVNILVTGGELSASTVAEWQLTIEPKNATMVDIYVIPIYHLFDTLNADEAAAKEALTKYIDANYMLKE